MNRKGQSGVEFSIIFVLAALSVLILLVVGVFITNSLNTPSITAGAGGGVGAVSDSILINNNTNFTLSAQNTSALIVSANNDTYIRLNQRAKMDAAISPDSDYIVVNGFTNNSRDANVFSSPFTFNFWMNVTSSACSLDCFFAGNGIIDGISRRWVILTQSSTRNLVYQIDNGTTQVNLFGHPDGYNLSVWTMVTFIWNGTNTFLYKNATLGNQQIGNLTNFVKNNTEVELRIGRNQIYFASFYTHLNGSIDEVRLYNRSLSQSEVSELYNSGRTPNNSLPSSQLYLWLSMNENSGTTLFDKSNRSNNGTLVLETGAPNTYFENQAGIHNLTQNTDFQLNGQQFRLINPRYAWDLLDADYQSGTPSTVSIGVNSIATNGTSAFVSFATNTVTWFILIGVVILIGITVLIIRIVRSVRGAG